VALGLRDGPGRKPAVATSLVEAARRLENRAGKSRRGKKDSDKGPNAAMLGGIVALLIMVAGAIWWFGFRDDGSTSATVADDVAMTSDDSSSSNADGSTDTAATDLAGNTGDDIDDSAAQAPAPTNELEQAPAPTATAKADPDKPEEPLPTLIEFEPFGPVEGTTAEQLAEWTEMLSELYIEYGGATGRTRKRLKAKVEAIDIIHATPAFLNAIIGADLARRDGILGIFTMVKDWQTRVASTPTFFFDGDTRATTVADQNKRVKVVKLWEQWWRGYASGKNDLDAYREKMEKRVKQKAG